MPQRSWFQAWRASHRARHRAWWEKRLSARDEVTLDLRHVYILPTRMGGLFGALLAVLLLASVSYQSNLSYLLTFLLASIAASAMFMTSGVLRGLRLHWPPPQAGFAQQPWVVKMVLAAETKRDRYAIGVRWYDASDEQSTWVDVLGQQPSEVELLWTPEQRGWQNLPWVVVHTRFPLGIFRAWSVWRLASPAMVYPAPEVGDVPWPASGSDAAGQGGLSRRGDEPDGVRSYRRGDPLKWVLWKRMAKSDQLLSREAESVSGQRVWFDYAQTQLSDPEARLSRLTAWVLRADAVGVSYGLRLPGQAPIEPATGIAHRQRCLQQLALFG